MPLSRIVLILFAISLGCPPVSVAAGEPTRESLREAWERVQAEDPQTLTFEPSGEDTYHFRTERFPFDATLRLLNVGLGERMSWTDGEEYRIGFVEVELVGLREDFGYHYSQSYGHWMQTNTLYWSDSDGRWYSQAE